eukprot:1158313-Pelagomonas_calceolata.AAC.2
MQNGSFLAPPFPPHPPAPALGILPQSQTDTWHAATGPHEAQQLRALLTKEIVNVFRRKKWVSCTQCVHAELLVHLHMLIHSIKGRGLSSCAVGACKTCATRCSWQTGARAPKAGAPRSMSLLGSWSRSCGGGQGARWVAGHGLVGLG